MIHRLLSEQPGSIPSIRLESKRVMKNLAYAELYETMFKFALAYADQKIPISMQGKDGEQDFTHFDRRDFLKKDYAGEW